MKTATISFCNGNIEQVIEHNDKHAILENIRLCVNLTADQKTAKVIRDQSDTNLLHFPHIMTCLSSGSKHWLFLTQRNHQNYCLLIERRVRNGYPYPKMMLPLFDFDDALFANTLFEVEVVALNDDKRHVILIADLLMLKNRNTREWDPLRRFNTIHSILKSNYRDNIVNQPCALQVKRVFTKAMWKEMVTFQRQLPYATRGIMLYPMNPHFRECIWLDGRQELATTSVAVSKKRSGSGAPGDSAGGGAAAPPPAPAAAPPASPPHGAMSGTAEDAVGKDCAMVKEWLRWQMDDEVDALQWCFELERTDMHADLYNAYLQVDGEMHYYDIVHVSSSEQAARLREAFAAQGGALQRVRTLCAYHRQFRKWYPRHHRLRQCGDQHRAP